MDIHAPHATYVLVAYGVMLVVALWCIVDTWRLRRRHPDKS